MYEFPKTRNMEFGILYQEEIRDSATMIKKIHETEVKLERSRSTVSRSEEEIHVFLRLRHSVRTRSSLSQGAFKILISSDSCMLDGNF